MHEGGGEKKKASLSSLFFYPRSCSGTSMLLSGNTRRRADGLGRKVGGGIIALQIKVGRRRGRLVGWINQQRVIHTNS